MDSQFVKITMLGTEILNGPLLATFFISATTLVLLYWYTTRNHNYWKNLGIQQAKTYPLIGSTYENYTKPIHEVVLKRYEELGPLYGFYEGNKPILSVADPAVLKDILVKDFQNFPMRRDFPNTDPVVSKMVSVMKGEDWKRVRNIITPTFTTGKIKRMFGIFEECSKTVLQNFIKGAESGMPVDCKRLFGGFTMDVIASSAFSTKLDSHNDPDNEFVRKARGVFSPKITWRFFIFLLMPKLAQKLRFAFFDSSPMQFFKHVTLQIIEERRRTGQTRNDFLQLLMDTAKEVSEEEGIAEKETEDITSNYGQDNVSQQILKNVTSKHLSMDELVAQCVIFFLAGYDTTGSTLSFAAYFLALNEDVQDKLREEIDKALANTDGKLTYEVVQGMKYLDNVIAETLRLFPPVANIDRTAVTDYKLGDTGITLEKDTVITVPCFGLHRDPKYFPDPEKFDPDRFTPEERAKRDPYVYLPFGAGPRNCVGMRFALMEIKVCLTYLIRHLKLKRCPETKVPMEFHNSQALINVKDVMVEVEVRKDV